MATKKTTKSTSKKKTTSKPKKEIKETKKVETEERELSTDFVDKKEKKQNKKPVEVKDDTKKIEKVESKETEIKETINNTQKKTKHTFVHFFLIVLLLIALGSFGINVLDKNTTINELISSLLITIFTVFFVTISISYHRKSKKSILLSSLLLLCYFLLSINNHLNLINNPIVEDKNFQGKNLTEVIKWASKNNVKVTQEYEYSDMISEYKVISQELEKKNNKITGITVSVSEGPNPDKEIIVPSMISWDDERVINFVKDNYLSNVIVDFVESDKAKDTVIEQSVSGNLKRSDELHLVFSYGEELGFSEVQLIDFTNMSKFEVEFYMKKNQLLYAFDDAFSSKIKKGFAMKQSVKAGETVQVNSKIIGVTISKGPKVKVPDLKTMSLEEITEWAIKNKVKLSFSDQYDESVKENKVLSANYEKDSIVEQGTVIKVVLSRGALKMPKFKSLTDFYNWANKYGINYEEKHEFSDTIKAGEIIKFSYKVGESIKNNDTIIVTISDGGKETVPNVIGLTKSEAISKLEKAHLNYSFVYKNSNRTKNKVLDQSISAGSEISRGTTITITLSSGHEDENTVEERKTTSNNSSNNNSNTNNHSNNNNNNSNNNTPTPPVNNCSDVTVYIYDELISNVPSTTCSRIKGAYPSLKFSCSYVQDSGLSNGLLKNATSIDGTTRSTCETINLVIVNNN
ncbi:MAG: PASTA domain-containing protein [Bacilli bacterium]|nr:PASTA domain-containing protein [Bacilli bacterium]